MKKLFYPLVFSLLFTLISASGTAAAEWTREYTEEITNGVIYKKILSYSSGEFSMLHVIECDLNNDAAALGVMTAQKGASYLETTRSMVENNNAIAGINGDFFNVGSKRTNMLGVVYQNGEMVSSPSKDVWATVAVTDAGALLMDYFGFEGKVSAASGASHELYQINKMPATWGAINMFTRKWGDTVSLTENMHALLIKDGLVTGRITVPGEASFGENDTMLVTNYTANTFFDGFAVGDGISIEYALTGTNEVIREAVGANTLIVKDGKRASFTHDAAGYAQRSAIGTNREQTKLYMVVAEGRQTLYRGFTQNGFADALIELGCYRAVNLDGGGSSTMAIRNEISGRVEIKNAISTERGVSTSVGLFNRLPYLGIAESGVAVPSDDVVLSGDYLDIYYKFYDKNSHMVYPSAVTVTTSNSSDTVSGSRVYFSGGGKRSVYVSFGGVVAECEVYVIDKVANAEIYPANLTVESGGTAAVAVTVWDSEGRKTFVHPENVNWLSSGVSMDNGKVGSGKGYVGADFGTVRAYCSVNGGAAPENVFEKNRFMTEEKTGTHIRISAGGKSYSTIADMIRVLNYEYSLPGADYLYMLNPPMIKELDFAAPTSLSKRTVDNTLVMTLDSSSGSIRTANQISELLKLKDTFHENIIIVTQRSPSVLAEPERELFLESLGAAAKKGKNVFVVHEDIKACTFAENGIYFIGLKSRTGTEISNSVSGMTADFYISGDDIRYSL